MLFSRFAGIVWSELILFLLLGIFQWVHQFCCISIFNLAMTQVPEVLESRKLFGLIDHSGVGEKWCWIASIYYTRCLTVNWWSPNNFVTFSRLVSINNCFLEVLKNLFWAMTHFQILVLQRSVLDGEYSRICSLNKAGTSSLTPDYHWLQLWGSVISSPHLANIYSNNRWTGIVTWELLLNKWVSIMFLTCLIGLSLPSFRIYMEYIF